MGYYSYKVEHDYGLAPNPFGGHCTLAICKGDIRRSKRLQLGDWIFGTGSAKLKNLGYLIYAMQVAGKISLDEYWRDERYQFKKPVLNGSLVQLYGDNIYHIDKDGHWVQDDSAHSEIGGLENKGHLLADTKGEYVLIAENFFYFGDQAIKVPDQFMEICNRGRNVKSLSMPQKEADGFVDWLTSNYQSGIHGDPINWKKYKFYK